MSVARVLHSCWRRRSQSLIGCVLALMALASSVRAGEMMMPCDSSELAAAARSLAVGEACVVRLHANPSTGYGWELLPIEPAIVERVGVVEFESAASAGSRLVGVGGEQVFRLLARHAGVVTLRWVYRRIWETDVPPADTYQLHLTVR